MLLPFDICRSNDQRHALHGWVRDLEILDDRLERAFRPPVVQLDLCDSWSVVRDRLHVFSLAYELVFIDEDELGILVHKAPDQPWASDSVDFDVLPCNPFHFLPPS